VTDFKRIAFVDEPAISGAQWWQDTLSKQEVSRRGLGIALVAGTAVLGLGACTALFAVAASSGSDSGSSWREPPTSIEQRPAVSAQRRFGWSFGAAADVLALGSYGREATRESGERALLASAALFAPTNAAYLPFHSGVLLEVGSAVPEITESSDTTTHIPFPEAYRAISTVKLALPYQVGAALAKTLDPQKHAVVTDLEGPESVALAAGLARTHTPVLMLQNWPHPDGVSKSHLTLAALMYFKRALETHAIGRSQTAAPVIVLERGRLDELNNPTEQFDNRYKVSLPPVTTLKTQGVTTVFLVTEDAAPRADIHQDLATYEREGIRVRMVRPSEFLPTGAPAPGVDIGYEELESEAVRFGLDPKSFAASYGDAQGTTHGTARNWRIAQAATPVPIPATVGLVPVMIGAGIIVAAQQRGTWSRTLYGSGGGG
jgi:hypothetical protein